MTTHEPNEAVQHHAKLLGIAADLGIEHDSPERGGLPPLPDAYDRARRHLRVASESDDPSCIDCFGRVTVEPLLDHIDALRAASPDTGVADGGGLDRDDYAAIDAALSVVEHDQREPERYRAWYGEVRRKVARLATPAPEENR